MAAWIALSATHAAAADPVQAPRGIRYVTLIRHGIYDRVDSLDDRVANGLNALGREQARLVGRRLAGLPVKPRVLVSSGLTRARETAAEIGVALSRSVAEDTLLSECTPPSSRPGFDQEHDAAEMAQCATQLTAAWEKYFRPSPEGDAQDILVCHGNVIRWFVTRALGADVRNWTSLDIAHASLSVIAVAPNGSTRLVLYSDAGHLPLEKQTWAGRGPGWTKPAK